MSGALFMRERIIAAQHQQDLLDRSAYNRLVTAVRRGDPVSADETKRAHYGAPVRLPLLALAAIVTALLAIILLPAAQASAISRPAVFPVEKLSVDRGRQQGDMTVIVDPTEVEVVEATAGETDSRADGESCLTETITVPMEKTTLTIRYGEHDGHVCIALEQAPTSTDFVRRY